MRQSRLRSRREVGGGGGGGGAGVEVEVEVEGCSGFRRGSSSSSPAMMLSPLRKSHGGVSSLNGSSSSASGKGDDDDDMALCLCGSAAEDAFPLSGALAFFFLLFRSSGREIDDAHVFFFCSVASSKFSFFFLFKKKGKSRSLIFLSPRFIQRSSLSLFCCERRCRRNAVASPQRHRQAGWRS